VTDAGIGLLAVVVLLIGAATAIFWPLRTARTVRLARIARVARARGGGDVALEIARDSKLGEINDLELDFRLGKLSEDDYRALNSALRSEAVELIRRIDSSAGASDGARPKRKKP
jgi:hypothetical protein